MLLAAGAAVALVTVVALAATVATDGSTPGRVQPASSATDAPRPGAAAAVGAGSGATSRAEELTRGPQMRSSPPVTVSLPSLNVSTSVIGLGLQADGTMQVPDDAETVGWYTLAPTPGSLGPAVLAGHVDWKGRPGAFANIDKLVPGDLISVRRQDGSVAAFAVTRVERYPKDRFPTEDIYGAIDHAGLRLITCGGEFDRSERSYRDNIVVYAALTHASPA